MLACVFQTLSPKMGGVALRLQLGCVLSFLRCKVGDMVFFM